MFASLSQFAAQAAKPVRWIVVAGIAYTLADGLWFFVAPPAAPETASVTRPAPTDRVPKSVDINHIKQRNLFGAADETSPAISAPTVETSLPLVLQGVFVANDHTDTQSTGDADADIKGADIKGADIKGAAIVAQKGKPGLTYQIGDTLPGNATLVEVHADHIVLQRAGAHEILNFPDPGSQLTVQTSGMDDYPDPIEFNDQSSDEPIDDPDYADSDYNDDDADQPTSQPTSAREFVEKYRSQISSSDPEDLARLGLEPVSESSASGYRLGALADSPYLKQTGLQAGDVLLSVNGRPVGDVRQDQGEIDNILAQGSARLEVQRGERRFFVTASLK